MNSFEAIETVKDKGDIKLTDLQRETNLFVKKMTQAKAKYAHVNEEYFEPIFKTLNPVNEFKNGCKLGNVEIVFSNVKKYYFVR